MVSWINLPQNRIKVFHCTWIMSLHYLVKLEMIIVHVLPLYLHSSLYSYLHILLLIHICIIAARSSHEKTLSVSLSNMWLWQNKRKLCPHSYISWNIIYPSFVTRRMVSGAIPSPWNFGSNWPHWSENADSQSIFARIATAVSPSKKSSINTNRKSTMCFTVSLRWTSYIAPKPLRGLETRNGRFSI